jgi:hypothetical protein
MTQAAMTDPSPGVTPPEEIARMTTTATVALMRHARERLTPANMIYLKPRAVRNRKQPARV